MAAPRLYRRFHACRSFFRAFAHSQTPHATSTVPQTHPAKLTTASSPPLHSRCQSRNPPVPNQSPPISQSHYLTIDSRIALLSNDPQITTVLALIGYICKRMGAFSRCGAQVLAYRFCQALPLRLTWLGVGLARAGWRSTDDHCAERLGRGAKV